MNGSLLDELDGYPIEVDPNKFSLVAPFNSDACRWHDVAFVNIHDENIGNGKATKYRLGRPDRRLPSEALAKTYGDFIARYPWHVEAKSLAPDGGRCTAQTCGLLRRMPVLANRRGYIGKETDRRWEQGEDISLLESKVTVYRPNETAKLAIDLELQHDLRRVSIRALARKAGLTESTLKAARRGDRLQKATVANLRKTVNSFSRAD